LLAGHFLVLRHPFPPDLGSPCLAASLVLGAASLLAAARAARRIGPFRERLARAEAALGAAALLAAGAVLGAEADRAADPLPVHPRAVALEVSGFVREVDAATSRAPSVEIEVRRVRAGSREKAVRARLLLRWRDPDTAPAWAVPGEWIRAAGLYRPPEGARNPGGFAAGRWLERQGLVGTLEVDPASVALLPARATDPGTLAAAARARIDRLAMETMSAPVAALVSGMLLNDRAGIAPAIEDSFRDGGTIHVLSISGLHVCVLAALIALLGRALRLPAGASAAAELAALWAYVAFVGAPIPAVRSAVLWTAIRVARAGGRTTRPFAAWGLAGLLTHLADPAAPLDAGFQLSFAAVLGLLASADLARLFERSGPPVAAGRVRSAVRGLVSLAAQSLGAEAATLGLQVKLFGAVPAAGLFLNLAVVPLCGVVLTEAVLFSVTAHVAPWLAPIAAGAVEIPGLALIALTRRAAAAVPAIPVHAAPSDAAVALALAALFLGACVREGIRGAPPGGMRARARVWGALALLLAAGAPLIGVERPPAPSGTFQILALDVGQGDAVIALPPSGAALLFDAGPAGTARDAGRAVVEPALREEGVRRLDLAVLSHAHRDHSGGLYWLARRGWLARLLENGSPRLGEERRTLEAAIASRGGVMRALRRDSTLALPGGASLRLLGAPRAVGAARSANADENDASLVATLSAAGWSALFPGDVEAGAERALAPSLSAAAVLKAPHHGSDTSCDPAFLQAVRPRVALVSCGEGNRFGHPARETLGRLERLGTRVFRTDREGAIRVTLDSSGIWVSTLAHPDPELVSAGPDSTLSP